MTTMASAVADLALTFGLASAVAHQDAEASMADSDHLQLRLAAAARQQNQVLQMAAVQVESCSKTNVHCPHVAAEVAGIQASFSEHQKDWISNHASADRVGLALGLAYLAFAGAGCPAASPNLVDYVVQVEFAASLNVAA